MRVSIIGAGTVGATLAMRIVESGLADVVLLDVLKSVACGKALDILDAAPIVGHQRTILGTDDYGYIKSSDIVVITAGLPRKPGMTREELIKKNAGIIREVSEKIKTHAPSSIVIVVTNPLDSMTFLAYKTTGFERTKVFGMAGVLDGARFTQLIADELKVKHSAVETYVLGSHGDTMVPILSHTSVSGKPIEKVISKERLEAIIKRTRGRGMEIVSLLGTGSAYYSPSAAVHRMITAIANDTKEVEVVSAYQNGEYGLNDLCIGVPCKIGKNGIEEIVKLGLSKDEMEALKKSAQSIKKSNEEL